MTNPVRLYLTLLKDREKLVFTQFQESVAFTAIHFLEIEYILIELYRRFYIAHFDCDVIASINLHAHECTVTEMQSEANNEGSHPGLSHETFAEHVGVHGREHVCADALFAGRSLLGRQSR